MPLAFCPPPLKQNAETKDTFGPRTRNPLHAFMHTFCSNPTPKRNFAIRIILGLPLVLFLPGYALIAALFIGEDDLDGIERIALSFGLSIAITHLFGLALKYTPFGILTLKVGEEGIYRSLHLWVDVT